jgi:haloalkane dehalogenase
MPKLFSEPGSVAAASPFPRRTVSLPTGDVCYIDAGTGPPLLMLHGAPMTSFGLERLAAELAPSFRVIVPDLPGFGGSTTADGFDGSLDCYSRVVQELVAALELERFFLFVMDSSGCLGLDAAAACCERLAGVILNGCVAFPLTGRAVAVKGMLRLVTSAPMRWLNRRANLLPWLVSTVAPFRRPFSRAERRHFQSQFDTPAKRDRILQVFGQMARDDRFMRRVEAKVRSSLRSLPALVVIGQLDPVRFVGAWGRYRAMFERAELRILPLEEHFPVLTSPERMGREIVFWALPLASAWKGKCA